MLPETPIFDGANPDFLLRFGKIFTGNLLGVSNFLGRAEAEALMKDLPYLNRSSDISRKQWHYESLVLLQLSNDLSWNLVFSAEDHGDWLHKEPMAAGSSTCTVNFETSATSTGHVPSFGAEKRGLL